MNTDLQIFKKENLELRTVLINEEVWFVAQDICQVLEINNTSQALSRLDEDEKNTIILNEGIGNPEKSIINESGLYSLVLSSKKPEAKHFKKWITSEVLPSIRKTGKYEIKPKELTRLEILQIALENEKKVLELQAINDEMKPKAEYFDALVDKNLLTNFRDTAKEFKINQNEFINFLLDKKFLYRDNKKQLKAYSKAIETGLMEYKEFINVHSKKTGLQILITPKGRETFRLLFCK